MKRTDYVKRWNQHGLVISRINNGETNNDLCYISIWDLSINWIFPRWVWIKSLYWITLWRARFPCLCAQFYTYIHIISMSVFFKWINRTSQCDWINCRLIHGHFHIGLVIILRPPYWPETHSRANLDRGMLTRPIWKCPCIKLFITYFRHLEKRHSYWPDTKSRPILARENIGLDMEMIFINPITGYFPGVWKYGPFTSGHIGHTKVPLFELSMQ